MIKLHQEVLWGSGQELFPTILLHSHLPGGQNPVILVCSLINYLLDTRFHTKSTLSLRSGARYDVLPVLEFHVRTWSVS